MPVASSLFFLADVAWPATAMPRAPGVVGHLLPSTGTIDGFIRVYLMGTALDEVRSTWLQFLALALVYGCAAYWPMHQVR